MTSAIHQRFVRPVHHRRWSSVVQSIFADVLGWCGVVEGARFRHVFGVFLRAGVGVQSQGVPSRF